MSAAGISHQVIFWAAVMPLEPQGCRKLLLIRKCLAVCLAAIQQTANFTDFDGPEQNRKESEIQVLLREISGSYKTPQVHLIHDHTHVRREIVTVAE